MTVSELLSFADRTRLLLPGEAEHLQKAIDLVCYPSQLNRQPRSLCYREVYKASEWLHLIMYNIPLVFRMRNPQVSRVIHPQIRRVLVLLSTALHLLLADKASVDENKRATIERRASVAECLIKEFLHEATRLLGPEHITYKFHELLHLPQNYRDFGPLYAVSAFAHEGNLGLMKAMIHGKNTHLLDKEICNKFSMQIRLAEILSSGRTEKRIRLTSRALPLEGLFARYSISIDDNNMHF